MARLDETQKEALEILKESTNYERAGLWAFVEHGYDLSKEPKEVSVEEKKEDVKPECPMVLCKCNNNGCKYINAKEECIDKNFRLYEHSEEKENAQTSKETGELGKV